MRVGLYDAEVLIDLAIYPFDARIGLQRPDGFEVSVLDSCDGVVGDPSRVEESEAAAVDRLVLGISPPHDIGRLSRFDFCAALTERMGQM